MKLQNQKKLTPSKSSKHVMNRNNQPKQTLELPALTQRIYQALASEFSKYEILLETTASRKVGGLVISHSFEGKSQMQRQRHIWQLLEKNLNNKEIDHIVGILTFTPIERQFILTE